VERESCDRGHMEEGRVHSKVTGKEVEGHRALITDRGLLKE